MKHGSIFKKRRNVSYEATEKIWTSPLCIQFILRHVKRLQRHRRETNRPNWAQPVNESSDTHCTDRL